MMDQKQNRTKALVLSLGSIIIFIVLLIILSQIKKFIPEKFERYAHGMLGIIAALISTWIFLRYEKKSFRDIGLKWKTNTFKKFLIGMAAGFFISAVMIISQVYLSGLEIVKVKNPDIFIFIGWALALFPLAFMEEIAFRGYPFIKLNKTFGFRITQIIIAVSFALYHVANGWPIGLSFLGPAIWSLAFGLSAQISGGISMPTGLHFGVNFILALFGAQKGITSIWTINFPGDAAKDAMETNERSGIAIQFILLVACIIATEWFIRRKKL